MNLCMKTKIIANRLESINTILDTVLRYLDRGKLTISARVSGYKGDYRIGFKLLGDLSNNNPANPQETVFDMLLAPVRAFFRRAKENIGIDDRYLMAIESFVRRDDILEWSWYEAHEVITGIIRLGSHGRDPDRKTKGKARHMALCILEEGLAGQTVSFSDAVKIVAFANSMDMAAEITLRAIEEGRFDLGEVRNFPGIELARDDTKVFETRFIDGTEKTGVILLDNVGEDVMVMKLTRKLLESGHKLILIGKEDNVFNDATKKDIEELLREEPIRKLIEGYEDRIIIISSGSLVCGLDLERTTPEFEELWDSIDYFISVGQGNYYTTRRFKLTKPGLYILRVKVREELKLENGSVGYHNGEFVAEFYTP